MKYFEFPSDLLGEDGDAVSPVDPLWEDIHYLSPGRMRPGKFDLWSRDCRGNPMGVNNW